MNLNAFSTFRRISYKWLFVYFNIFILLTLISFSPLVNSLRLRSCRESAGRLQCRLHLRLGAGKWVSWWIPCRNLLFRPVAQKQPKNRGRIRFRDATIGFSWNQSFLRICAQAWISLNQTESSLAIIMLIRKNKDPRHRSFQRIFCFFSHYPSSCKIKCIIAR